MGKGRTKGGQGEPVVTVEYTHATPEQRAENRRTVQRALEAAAGRKNRFPVKAELSWRAAPKGNHRP